MKFFPRQDSSRRFFLMVVLLVLPLSGVGCAQPSMKAEDKTNCLIITIDTLRADRLSSFGSRTVETPNIDRLAVEGLKFTRCFAHTVTTLPSHANILLGVLPPYHGVHDNANFTVPDSIPSLAEVLKEAGYDTAAFIGAYPLDRRFGLGRGFALYDDDYGVQDFSQLFFVERPAGQVINRASEWLKKASMPWFLWVHLFDPHAPYNPPEPFLSQYKDNPYDGEVAYVDQILGDFFSLLRQTGRYDDTLIILTSDHGESLGEHGERTHGYLAYNSTLHVPLIIRAPGYKGEKSEASVVSHIDIFPTVCDVLKLKKPANLQGRSLLPALKGKKLSNEKVLFESLYPYYSRGWAPITGYIDFPMKFIDSLLPELYNLETDFKETKNLASGRDLENERKLLAGMMEAAVGPAAAAARVESQSQATLEKLRNLGYIGAGAWPLKENFKPSDDVKSFMPFESRAEEAMDLFKSGDRVRIQEAISILEANIQQKEDHDLSYSYLASLYFELGKYREALAVLRQGLEKLPGNYTIFLSYISTLLQLGEYEEVVRSVDRLDYFLQAQNDPEIWNSFGAAYVGLGRYDEARPRLEKALALDPDFPPALSNLGFALLMKARSEQNQILLKESMEKFKQAISQNQAFAPAYNGLGAAYKTAGEVEAAIECWLQALSLDPELDQVLYNLGYAYLEKGDKEKALKFLLKYKERVYNLLSPLEKLELDELIRKSR